MSYIHTDKNECKDGSKAAVRTSTDKVMQRLSVDRIADPERRLTALEIINQLGDKWCLRIHQESLMRLDAFNDTFFLKNKDKIDWKKVYEYCKKHRLEAQDIDKPWQLVAFIGDVKIIKKYLEKNPRFLTQQDCHFRTPLHFAAWGGNVEAVKFLLDRVVVNTNTELSPLYYAKEVGATKVIQCLESAYKPKENQNVVAEEKQPHYARVIL